MNSSEQNPKLPTWLFVLIYLALIGAAVFIAVQSARPLTNTAIIWIVALVIGGAIVALVPVVANYERQKNEALDERQRALEALARTVSSSAEQISIAANGLHEIAELAQRNLKHAEQLPHKLQDKMAEFQAQLAVVEDAEKEELERELLALRTSESERLDSVSQRIAKSAAEWTKLEAATQQHLAAANEALAKLALGTASAIGKAQAAAEQALSQARIEAARSLGDASGHGAKTLEAAKTAALAELDARVAAASREAAGRIAADVADRLTAVSRALDEKITRLAAVAAAPALSGSVDTPAPAAAPAEPVAPPAAEPTPPPPAASEEPAASPPKRPRRIRREEPPADSAPASVEPVAVESAAPPAEEPAPAMPVAEEPPPIVSETIPEITPVAPHTAEPFADHLASSAPPATAAAPTAPETETAKPARKRAPAARKPEPAPEADAGLDLELDDAASTPAASVSERVLTSDGATRLVVTAYIGIGNRLFIRGTGPGLTWEKGVPLQFVSIGKWRWETNDASAPVQFKLYKNDDLECAALGAQTLDPGHQQEVTAAF